MHARQCDSLSVWYRGSVLMGESEYVHVRESVRARSRVCVCVCVRVYVCSCGSMQVCLWQHVWQWEDVWQRVPVGACAWRFEQCAWQCACVYASVSVCVRKCHTVCNSNVTQVVTLYLSPPPSATRTRCKTGCLTLPHRVPVTHSTTCRAHTHTHTHCDRQWSPHARGYIHTHACACNRPYIERGDIQHERDRVQYESHAYL